MAGFYEQLSEEDKAKVDSWSRNAKKSLHDRDIPPELFIGAQLGMYYGWEARVAFGLGYIIGIDDDGKLCKIPYTFKQAVADVKAADKVHYRRLVDNGDIIAAANISSRNSTYARNAINYSNELRKKANG